MKSNRSFFLAWLAFGLSCLAFLPATSDAQTPTSQPASRPVVLPPPVPVLPPVIRPTPPVQPRVLAPPPLEEKTWAVMVTSQGVLVLELFASKAPKTVANFVGLATGSKAWKHPKTGEWQYGQPFYNGLIFHRIIPDFMIQGGCPLGQGNGGPGYSFEDEFHPDLRHDGPGVLSMANSGPNTNGSQFFITHKATPWLDAGKMKVCANFDRPVRCMVDMHCAILAKRYPQFANGKSASCSKEISKGHSVFGKVVHGGEIVQALGKVPRDGSDRPLTPVVLKAVHIRRAPAWDRAWLQLQ